ncbi:MAG TPA: hypothetical protein PKD86_12850, partial [Gemmatales bacterium]|nr:hypothetical protein [Gemmatales bacterium]
MANWTGKVVAVHVGEQGQPLRSVEAAEAVAGVGLEGDRYAQKAGTFSKKHAPDREITLIEMEALTALERDYAIRLTAL